MMNADLNLPMVTRPTMVVCPAPNRMISYRVDGDAEVWFLAICQDCEPRFPQPFTTAADRDSWKAAHEHTSHRVKRAVEIRSAPE